MPQKVIFNNKEIVEPGAYSQIVGAAQNNAAIDTFGVVMIIDTGLGKDFIGRSGIVGTVDTGGAAIYEADTKEDAKLLMRGGILWDLMDYLFAPSLAGNGTKKLYFARAATTTPAKIVLTFANTQTITIQTRHEGTVGNGVLTSGVLTRGFAAKLLSGVLDISKYVIACYAGQFKGLDANGVAYEYSEADLAANNIVQKLNSSKELATFNDLINFFKNDSTFNQDFEFVSSTGADFNLAPADLTALSSYQLFTGGTCQYASARVDDIINNIIDLDVDQFLCVDYGKIPSPAPTAQQILDGINQGAQSTNNAKILTYLATQSSIPLKAMYVGGGNKSDEFDVPTTSDGTIQTAAFYNSALVHVIHSGPKIINRSGVMVDVPISLYTAAMVCGRVAGLLPQDPVTYKDIRVKGMVHVLSQPQRVKALESGVIHIKNVNKLGWVVNQGVNTLQSNSSDIYVNGTSPSTQTMRIFHQVNKELQEDATTRFPGGNLKTVSDVELKAYTESFLRDRTEGSDPMLISFKNVTVSFTNSQWQIRYCATPNSEVDQLFFTGVMLDPNVQL